MKRHKNNSDSGPFRAEKLSFSDRLRRDPHLSVSARLVGAEIVSRSWEQTGCTDAEAWFVTVLGLALSTVKSAIRDLKNAGWIRVEKCGRQNVYFLNLGKGQNLAPLEECSGRLIGSESRFDWAKSHFPTGPGNRPLIPSTTHFSSHLDRDPDVDAEARRQSEHYVKANSLARQLAEIAGIPDWMEWPLHWQDAAKRICDWWIEGLTTEVILAGTRLSMQQKRTAGPPTSIAYFDPEIRRVAVARGLNVGAVQSPGTAAGAR